MSRGRSCAAQMPALKTEKTTELKKRMLYPSKRDDSIKARQKKFYSSCVLSLKFYNVRKTLGPFAAGGRLISNIRSLADRLEGIQSDGFWDEALSCLPSLGLSKVVFLDLSRRSAPIVRSNAGQLWNEKFIASVKGGNDPFAANCLSRIDPVQTGIAHLEPYAYLSDPERDLIAQGSEELGIQTGMSVTIRPHPTGAGIGWNLMTGHCVREFAQLRAHYEPDWRAWCQLVFAGLTMQGSDTDAPSLTPREQDCLAYIADGKRTVAVAYRLGISETTVEMHLRNARNRLGAKTRDQAVAIAIRKRLI
jgi:DNA-binding CsgD family transcriptional regulator